MIVTVWRHAEAGMAPTDASRPITPRGREALQSSGAAFIRWLDEANIAPVSSLLYSPYLRTRESAQVLQALCFPSHVAAERRLAPGADIDDVAELVPSGAPHLLLVSHHPLVSALIAFWCDEHALAPLLPGGAATLTLLCAERGGAELLHYHPDAVWSAP